MVNDPHPVVKQDSGWMFCRLQNDETKEIVAVYLRSWLCKKNHKVRWKNQVWTVKFPRKESPTPFLGW